MPILKLYSPVAYQTFQQTDGEGEVVIAGEVNPPGSYTLEARWNEGEWQSLSTFSYMFTAELPLPAGQGTLEVRVGDLVQSVPFVGIGDVYIVAGQSNASGRGTQKLTYSHPTLKAALHKANYQWGELLDWTDNPTSALDAVSTDGSPASAYGSVWPALATHLMAAKNYPVAFIPVCKGGTSITQWLPSADRYSTATLYGAMMRRTRWAGDVKAVLWWQGETDAGNMMPGNTYASLLLQLANEVWDDLHVPMIATCTITMLAIPGVRTWQINEGIRRACALGGQKLQLGPDLSDLLSDDEANQHITAPAKLQAAAVRWAAALGI